MKIESILANQTYTPPVHVKRQNEQVEGNGFKDLLHVEESKRVNTQEEEIKKKLDSINKIKEDLEENLTIENLDRYKNEVKEMMHYYVKNVIDKKEVVLQDRRGNGQKLTVVETVNQKLENMTHDMLKNQFGQITMLKRIGEIQGLLVNILV